MQTLYRKYRAKTFKELIGQDQTVKIIKQSIIEGRVAHAYLFTGSRGTGKTSLARLLAKVLNCTDVGKDGDSCNKCRNCLAINKGNFMDLIEIDAASNRGIEEIRSLKEKVSFLPVEGKNKVFIIDEVHMLTSEAFNALLKTLEEPPKRVVFILATTEPHRLPLTIVSRTQRFDLKFANDQSLSKKLEYIVKKEGYNFDKESICLIVKAGQGSFRDAETVLEKVLTSIDKERAKTVITRDFVETVLGFVSLDKVQQFLSALLQKDLSNSLAILHTIWEQGVNLSQFVIETLDEAREEMLNIINQQKGNTKDLKALLVIIKELNQANNELKNNLLSILTLEIAVFNIIGVEYINENNNLNTDESKAEVEKFSVEEAKRKKTIKIEENMNTPVKKEEKVNFSIEYKFNLVKKNFTQILTRVKGYNHFLTAILSGSQIILENNQICFKVKTSFHKQRLENIETKKLLTKIIEEICGISIDFNCIIGKSKATKKKEENNAKLVEEIFN